MQFSNIKRDTKRRQNLAKKGGALFFPRDAAAMHCGTVFYAQARNRNAQTNSNQKLIKKAMPAV